MRVVLLTCLFALAGCLDSGTEEDLLEQQAGVSCTSDRMCEETSQRCDFGLEVCVDCRSDSECRDGQQCIRGYCFALSTDGDCVGSQCLAACPGGVCETQNELPGDEPDCDALEECCAYLDEIQDVDQAEACYMVLANPNHPTAGDCGNPIVARLLCPLPPTISCDDGISNGDETDVDCGGPTCTRCRNASRCLVGRDCLGGTCTADKLCVARPGTSECPQGTAEVGRFSEWCGKVNIHTDPLGSAWVSDPDCSSGCGQDPLTYCRKFYPNTQSTTTLALSGDKVFETAGCDSAYTYIGELEVACCQAL